MLILNVVKRIFCKIYIICCVRCLRHCNGRNRTLIHFNVVKRIFFWITSNLASGFKPSKKGTRLITLQGKDVKIGSVLWQQKFYPFQYVTGDHCNYWPGAQRIYIAIISIPSSRTTSRCLFFVTFYLLRSHTLIWIFWYKNIMWLYL